MNERFCRATLSDNVPCAPAAAAASLRKFIEQDPDIDSTTLGNLEAAAAALDELTYWASNSTELSATRLDTTSLPVAGPVAPKKPKKSKKDKLGSAAAPSAIAKSSAGSETVPAPEGTAKKKKRHKDRQLEQSKKQKKSKSLSDS